MSSKLADYHRTIIGLIALLVIYATPIAYARLSALDHALHATVLIYSLDNHLDIIASGSGSIVDQRGLILTNFQVVGDPKQNQLYNDEGLVAIAITRDTNRPAIPLYIGQVVRSSARLDLAVVQVIADLQGNKTDICPKLPAYDIDNSEQILIGEEIAIIGVTGIGDERRTITHISGFDSKENKTIWIKTDSEIKPSDYGGAAISDEGQLIGILTAGEASQAGKVGLIRPIKQAMDLLSNFSSLGIAHCDSQAAKAATEPITGLESSFLGFTLQPADEKTVSQAPSGSKELDGHFSYRNISPNTSFRSQWSLNGKPLEETRLEFENWPLNISDNSAYVWTKDENGLQDGTYSLEVQIGDLPIISGEIDVGGWMPPPVPELFLTGRIISADNGKALKNATFVVLTPGITWKTFDSSNRHHIHELLFTDMNGDFETLTVSLDTIYSIGIFAEGYEPIKLDAFEPKEYYETGNFLELGDIELKQQ